MDVKKTGRLIAERRKELGLTQKQLAERLHVSDRAVSKWERRVGFPDIALLEPLADELGLPVLSLLHGEEATEPPSDATVREVVGTVYDQTRRGLLKKVRRVLNCVFYAAAAALLVFVILYLAGAFVRPVELTVPVGLYVDGELVEESSVHISGTQDLLDNYRFSGSFAVECIEKTCRDGASAGIVWREWSDGGGYQSITYLYRGAFLDAGIESMLYISKDMRSFGLRLEGGGVIATDEFYAKVLELDGYYPFVRY